MKPSLFVAHFILAAADGGIFLASSFAGGCACAPDFPLVASCALSLIPTSDNFLPSVYFLSPIFVMSSDSTESASSE